MCLESLAGPHARTPPGDECVCMFLFVRFGPHAVFHVMFAMKLLRDLCSYPSPHIRCPSPSGNGRGLAPPDRVIMSIIVGALVEAPPPLGTRQEQETEP